MDRWVGGAGPVGSCKPVLKAGLVPTPVEKRVTPLRAPSRITLCDPGAPLR